MEVFVLMNTLILLILLPVIRGKDEFNGNGEVDDMNIDQSSLSSKCVYDSLKNMPLGTIDDGGVEAQLSNDHNQYDIYEADDLLMNNNENIVDILRRLEIKLDRVLDGDGNNDLHMSDIMNKLDKINRYIISSDKNTDRMKCLGKDGKSEIRLIEELADEIAGTNKRIKNIERNFDEVMTDIKKSIQSLDKVSYTGQDIDQRTIRILHETNRQQKKTPGYILNEDIRSSNNNPTLLTSKFNEGDTIVGSRNPTVDFKKSKTENPLKKKDVIVGNRNLSLTPTSTPTSKSNCHELITRRNGIYKFASQGEVANEAGRFFYERYCDFDTDGVAWTVIQRRHAKNRKVNFNRSWLDYKLGFGKLDDEFWFGNDFIHKLTSGGDMELRIVLDDTSGRHEYAEFSMFKIESEKKDYKLMINDYRGSGGFDFLSLNGQKFSTYDRQNDEVSCPLLDGSGWWFKSCVEINWLGTNSLKASKMMIRPKFV